MSVDVNVEKLDAVRRRLTVTVPAAKVADEWEGAVRDLARSAKVPGFRPGRVPRGVLEKRFGERLRADIHDRLMRTSLAEALEKEHLHPLAPPEILTESDAVDGDFRYSATVEVKPEVTAHDYTGLDVERPLKPTSASDVDAFLERLRESHAQLDPVEERNVVGRGDVASLDFTATVDGRRLDAVEGRQVEVGASGFPDGFDDGLVGTAVGESRVIRVTYPESFSESRLAGKEVEFDVRVQGLFTKTVPALDDEFAKDVGDCGSLDELRDKVRGRFDAENARTADEAVRESLIQQLVSRHDEIELPVSMVQRRTEALVDDVREEWRRQRIWPSSDADLLRKLREDFEPRARDQVRLSLVLEAIGRQEGLEVSEAEVDDAIERMLGGADVPAEQASAYLRHPEVRAGVHSRIQQSKVLDFVVSRANVTTIEKETDIADPGESD